MNNKSEQSFFIFPKKEKLKSKIEIDLLFSSGIVAKQFPFRLLYTLNSNSKLSAFPHVLVSVPKRKHKHAVSRNLLKRRIKEAYRLNKPKFEHDLKKIKSIAIIYVSNQKESFNFINDKLILALDRLSKTLNKEDHE